MLGNAALSEAPLSSEAGGIFAATYAMAGAANFAAVGVASAAAILAATGSGSLTAVGAATASGALAVSGAGSFSPIGLSTAATSFAIFGAGAFTALGEPIYRTPAYRTATVPLVSRVLVLAASNRIDLVPAPPRVEAVLATSSRTLKVPALGNT